MSEIRCRPLTLEDSLDVLGWRNDPFTRLMSLNDNIISKIEHSDWFAKMLASDVDIGLIGEMDRSKVGVVFFKIENFHTVVSINLNPLYRGKKLAATLLRNAMHDAQKMSPNIDHFVAEIKDTNTASIKVFYQNGFTLNSKKDHSGIYSVQSSRFGVKTDVSN